LNAIIGTVGGSMGLFLGLSFADLAIALISRLVICITERCKARERGSAGRRPKCAQEPTF
jgi:hypothetical protein